MMTTIELVLRAVLIGAGATVVMDLWSLVQRRVFKVPSLDYAMVGRWLGHMPRGCFIHEAIARATPVPGERAIGWTAHYLTGILFAAALLAICGPDWARAPTLMPALLAGLVTVAAPFLILQPGIGAGVAASRTPAPGMARIRSIITHLVFGLGLYIAAKALAVLFP